MLRLAALTASVLALAASPAVQAETLCSLAPGTYSAAKLAYPASAFAIEALEGHGFATWYSDRNSGYADTAAELVSACDEDARMTVVVYGLPNKDCDAGESTVGSTVTTAAEYVTFLNTLTDAVGSRKVLYILEPDAIGLLAKTDGCGQEAGYLANLEVAIELLSANDNAEIYLDVGYWTLEYTSTASTVAGLVSTLASYGSKVKGITINTSNYRSDSELATLCSNFQSAMGSSELHCIFDTSRNYNGAAESDEWCNLKTAGVGPVPTSDTGIANVDYFLWIKPVGESDGTCSGCTSDAISGPTAGDFSDEIFQSLWNQGFLVAEKGYDAIDGTIHSSTTSASASSSTTQASSTSDQTQTQGKDQTQDQMQDQTQDETQDQTQQSYEQTSASTSASASVSEDASASASASASAASLASANSTTTDAASIASEADPATVQSAEQTESVAQTTITEAPTPAPTETDSSSSSGNVQQVSTESSAGGSMSSSLIVMVALVGAAVVALMAVLGVRHRQKKMLAEAKTPQDAFPTSTMASFGGHQQLATARESNIL